MGALLISGCHKDSFDFDEFTRPTAATPDDGTGLSRTPNIAIFSPPTAQEGDAVVLMITSDADAPADGLAVMITIGVAMDGEFNANAEADCTTDFPRCIVTIPAGSRAVSLTLSPLSDFSTEHLSTDPGERWTATLVDGDDYDLAANNNAAFDITDLIAAVGIATSDSVMEGNAVVLTITSSIAAPTNGLTVTINIGVADVDEFTTNADADCTTDFPRCIVTIPVGSRAVSLTLSPLSDFSTEPGERWTATLVNGDDYDLAAGGDDNVDFAITDLIAAVGIMTSNTGIEGGAAVTLTITSSETVPATLTDGLTVTINIGDADATEFTSADCIGLVCEVVIDPTEMTAILIITPSPDTAVEGGSEDWTATIAPDTDNNIFMVDSSANDAVFAVANMLPPVVDGTMLTALNAYATPTALSVEARRAGQVSADVGPITGSQYNDADDNPRVLVERLDYAHLGIRINGDIAAADFDFAHLNENVVTPPTTASTLPTATYALEGEMTYNGNRFYPDGALMADFANARIGGEISLDGAEAADDFGGTTFADGTTLITNTDNLTLGLGDVSDAADSGGILGDVFSGDISIIANGFFASLNGISTGTYRGRFNDAASYVGAPQEVSGIFESITDASGNELKGGFLGQCSADCDPLPIISISSSADTIQEGGQVALMITSNTVAPMGGFLVTIDISGTGLMANEFTTTPASVCDSNLVCRLMILETERSVNLVLEPTDDSDDTENTENWMATLRDGSNYNLDAANNNVAFDIVDTLTLPTAMNGRTLAELNAYDIPTALSVNLIRNLQSDAIDGVTISASRYGDAAAPDVFVQMLEFAALGVWVNGNTPEIGMTDHDFDYAFLGDNGVNPPAMSDGRGDAIYNLEGDATYLGINFFPEGVLTMHFDAGTFEGNMVALEGTGQRLNYYGGADPAGGSDFFAFSFTDSDGRITANGFEVSGFSITGLGFFSGLNGVTTTSLTGRFYNGPGYNPAMAAPTEMAGVVEITNGGGMNDLHMGFLGRIEP